MPGNARDMIKVAEQRFPVRIRLAVPPLGFGQRLPQMDAWLDQNCGADGWTMTPSGGAVAIYFRDATLASPLSPDGVSEAGSRLLTACFRCAMMSRRRGLARSSTAYREAGLWRCGGATNVKS